MKRRSGVTNTLFAVTVVVLVVVAVVGYGLYAANASKQSQMEQNTGTSDSAMTETLTSTETMNQTYAYPLTPQSGAMVDNAWLLVVPLGMHQYAVSVHAEGLETNGTYILEGTMASGNMQTVPISTESMTMNDTAASEFQSNSNGTGLYWIILSSDPMTTFESIQLYFIQGGMMENASLIATADLTMMSQTSMTSSGM